MFGLGPMELAIIAAVGAMVFGAGKLPELGRGAGQMFSNFRKEIKNIEHE